MGKKRFVKNVIPYLFILSRIIGLIVFVAGPLILPMVMSFFDWPVTSSPTFRGIGNYVEMFTKDKQFYKSLTITLKYTVIFAPLNMIVALFLAMLITQPVKGVKAYWTIFYIPAVISGVAISIIWGWVSNGNYRVLNYLPSPIGVEGPDWLVDPTWALLAVILASAFRVGTMMLIFYMSIKSIPIDLYEAAFLDGTSPARQLFSVILPTITPTILFNLITSLISAFQQLTLAMLFINGGPLKFIYFYGMPTYDNTFKHHRLGYANANAWVVFIVILFPTAIIFRSSFAWVFYETETKNGRARDKKKGRKAL